MVVRHTVRDIDTLESLANRYFDDHTRWEEIADYNSLDYPYIVQNDRDKLVMFARGSLRVERRSANSDMIIYKGSTFRTRTDAQGIQKVYEAIHDTEIPAGEHVGHILVKCTLQGSFGNTIAESITEVVSLESNIGSVGLDVTNPLPITNGTDIRVLTVGDIIYIPTEERRLYADDYLSNNYLRRLGGVDVALNGGDIDADETGDIATVMGIKNIEQAVTRRFMTERGTDPHNPNYGSEIHGIIGDKQTPHLEKLIELDILFTMRFEDRVQETKVRSVRVEGRTVFVELTLKLSETIEENLNLALNY